MNNNISIIFDLDGTLWDSTEIIYHIWKREFNIDRDKFNSLMGMSNLDIINNFDIDKKDLERVQILTNEEVKNNGGRIYNNIIYIIKKLSKEYNLYIVSNCQSGYIETFLDYYKLNDCFIDIECFGNTLKEKEYNIKEIIKRNNINNCIYVGDTLTDYNAAKSNNIKFINAKYGFGNFKSRYEINDISEIFNIIEIIKKEG